MRCCDGEDGIGDEEGGQSRRGWDGVEDEGAWEVAAADVGRDVG